MGVITVPVGDGQRYNDMGFKHVVELGWWEKQAIAGEFKFDGSDELLPNEVAQILRKGVAVPKIGSRIDLAQPFQPTDCFSQF